MEKILASQYGHQFIRAENLGEVYRTTWDWLVNGFFTEGVCVLDGREKSGKTALALSLALAVSRGEQFLGKFKTTPANVLYIPYNDAPPRLKYRLRIMRARFQGNPPAGIYFPQNLSIGDVFAFPKLNAFAGRAIATTLNSSPNLRLIIIDDLESAFIESGGKPESAYRETCTYWDDIRNLALKNHVCIIFIRNQMPRGKCEHYDTISRAVDTRVELLPPPSWMSKAVTTIIRTESRDFSALSLPCNFNPQFMKWEIIPEEKIIPVNSERRLILDAFGEDGPVIKNLSELIEKLGQKKSTVVRVLSKMVKAGQIKRVQRGKYTLGTGSR
jgi:hypothetical protein